MTSDTAVHRVAVGVGIHRLNLDDMPRATRVDGRRRLDAHHYNLFAPRDGDVFISVP